MIVATMGLTKRYGDRAALSDVDIAVAAGSIYGLVGPNGAGKTTLLTMLAGLRRPTSGRIQLDVARRRVAVLPDSPRFEPWLTGHEVVALAAHLAGVADGDAAVKRVLRDAGLADRSDTRVGTYSRGMLQRLGLAATLVSEPELLLLDEPASALDPAGRREVLDLIARLRGRATVIFSSHLLGDVQEVCETVGILNSGRLLYQGALEQLLVGRAVPAYRLRLRAPVPPVLDALRAADWVTEVRELPGQEVRVAVRSVDDAERQLPALLATSGARLVSVLPEAPDLEDVFLELTS